MSGLWHGSNWTFVIWGALHGIGCVFLNLVGSDKKHVGNNFSLSDILPICITNLFVCFVWLFFRADNLTVAKTYLIRIFSFSGASVTDEINYFPATNFRYRIYDDRRVAKSSIFIIFGKFG